MDEFVLTRDDGTPFLAKYPVWTVMVDEVLRAKGPTRAVCYCSGDQFKRFFPLYTDDHLADQFVRESVMAGLVVYAVPDYKALASLLFSALLLGATHVGFDCPCGPNLRNERSHFVPVSQVARAVLGLD